jgi:hypothetical protein
VSKTTLLNQSVGIANDTIDKAPRTIVLGRIPSLKNGQIIAFGHLTGKGEFELFGCQIP